MTLATLNTEINFIDTWFCNICEIETGLDSLGSVWCECD